MGNVKGRKQVVIWCSPVQIIPQNNERPDEENILQKWPGTK